MIIYPPPAQPAAGALLAANNLSEIASAAAARTRLDVRSVAESFAGDVTRAVGPYLLSDGATSGRTAKATLGTTNAVNGGLVIVQPFMFQMPATNPATEVTVVSWGSDVGLGPSDLIQGLAISTAGTFQFRRNTDGSNRANLEFTGAPTVATHGGRWVRGVLTVTPGSVTQPSIRFSTGTIIGTQTGSWGSPPDFLSIASGVVQYGRNMPAGCGFVPYAHSYGAWSDAEADAWIVSGIDPHWCAAATGSAVEKIQNGDMSSATGWSFTGGWAITGGKLVHTGTSSFGSAGQLGKVVAGRKYRAAFSIEAISGNSLLLQNGTNTTLFIESGVGTKVREFIATETGDIKFKNPASGALECVIDDFSLRDFGPPARWAFVPGVSQASDQGANGIPLNLTAGMQVVGNAPIGTRAPMSASYAHTAISTSAGTTFFFHLPPGWSPTELQVNPDVPLDPGTLIYVGTSTNAGRWVNGLAVSSAGLKYTVSLQNFPQSLTSTVAVSISKNQVTTTGNLIVVTMIIERKY